jgi:hypothetical protein|tara:strand:- start:1505 stop:2308 length:804 start_codon:yes stop_codon:yes gene_type:complete
MLGQQFYHETMRKVIISFGTMFNDIHLVRKDNNGTITQSMKVPLAYGPREKFLVRLREDADLTKQVALTLPRMGFEIKNLSYDSARKLNRVQRFKTVKGSETKQLDTQYMPVPYNLDIELYVMAKQSDDALQIVEQILPYFQPDYTITVADLGGGTKRDVPVVLNSITYEDNYEGEFEQRRALIYTLAFTAKFYLYGPVSSSKVIKTVSVDQYTDMPDKSPRREQRYTVTPNPSTADADDNFGFNETTSFFQDAQEYDEKTGDDEEN